VAVYLVLFALLSYILGSIPFSYLAGKIIKGIDLRQYGSGNLGATNTYRMLGFGAALTVGILDAVKALFPVLLFPGLIFELSGTTGPADLAGTETIIVVKMIIGLCAIAGHIWTVFLGFRGGKGVTTAFGVFLGIAPVATAFALLVWIVILSVSKKVSLASVSAAVLYPIFLLVFREGLLESEMILFLFSLIIAILVVYTHKSNLLRLFRGEEKNISREVKDDDSKQSR
jgi:glycerol-3-phosphate acyltransferase PlsY